MSSSKSFQDLTLKLELDIIKENLLKETFSSNLEKNENKPEYFTRSVIKNMLLMKKTNNLLSHEILEKKKNILLKEKLIRQLCDEFSFQNLENIYLKSDYKTIVDLKNKCEINRNGVTDYCNHLKTKFKSFVQIIEKYEENICDLKKKRENIIKSSDVIIEMKSIYINA